MMFLKFKHSCICILLGICIFNVSLDGQIASEVIGPKTRLFKIPTSKDTIQFIKLDTSLQFKKPVFIMLQGSLPIPLMISSPAGNQHTSFPFSTEEIRKSHHIINISMPHVPVLATVHQIAPDGRILNPSRKYNQANFLNNYVRRTSTVIEYLKAQNWVDTSEIVLFGHSQGSYVAIKTALENKSVTHVGLSSFSPTGRMSGQIQKLRMLENSGLLSGESAQDQITKLYDRWAYISKRPDDDTATIGDTFKATVSFSEDFTDDLIELKTPLFISYGSKDYGALGCDLLPVIFETNNKEKYKIVAYPGLGHNYEEIDVDGHSNYEQMQWQKAFDQFAQWLDDQEEP